MDESAASILAKLKNVSRSTGRSYQLCLQLYCQEEFLRRLESSKYCKNFILKGGFLIYSLTGFEGRLTYDIDFLLNNMSNEIQNMEIVMREILEKSTNNKVVQFLVRKITLISTDKEYIGLNVKLEAIIENTITPFSLDFGVGDVVIPEIKIGIIPTQLSDFKSPKVYTYPMETVISEKLDSILYLMDFTSRMKDYFDIYYLSQNFEFESKILTKAMMETFKNRNRNFTPEHLNTIMQYADDYNMNRKWTNFISKLDDIELDFKCVLRTLNNFLCTPFNNYILDIEETSYWSCIKQTWETDRY